MTVVTMITWKSMMETQETQKNLVAFVEEKYHQNTRHLDRNFSLSFTQILRLKTEDLKWSTRHLTVKCWYELGWGNLVAILRFNSTWFDLIDCDLIDDLVSMRVFLVHNLRNFCMQTDVLTKASKFVHVLIDLRRHRYCCWHFYFNINMRSEYPSS